MKNYLIILVIMFTFCAYSYEKVYLSKPNSNYYNYYRQIYNPYSTTYFTPNVPYSNFYSPYGYNRNIRLFKGLQRLKRNFNYSRYLSFNFWKKGSMTGYSPPITNDIYQNLGFNPNDKKQKLNSPTTSTEIFSFPNMNNSFDRHNGQNSKNDGGAVGKMGVTIIYD